MPSKLPDVRQLEVSLNVGSNRIGGWKEVSIMRSIEHIAGSFDISMTDLRGAQGSPLGIVPGQPCVVQLGGVPVITGFIDDVEASHSGASHALTVRGRDRTGDLVDCASIFATQEWVGRTLVQVAQDLCKPFSILVKTEASPGAPFKYTHVQPGETVFETLERAARLRGVLLVSDGLGSLVITRAGGKASGSVVMLGSNILAGSSTQTHKDRFSLYKVIGQDRGDEFMPGELSVATEAISVDPQVLRYRPLVVLAEDPVNLQDVQTRALWERSVRAARALQATITVRGWTHSAGLWAPNQRVGVEDRFLGLHGQYLVSGVTYRMSEGGQLADLQLAPPGAFELMAVAETAPASAAA